MVYLITGVSGSGKSTIGAELAHRLGIPFMDGDSFHTASAIERMRQGIPLTDADRMPWLQRMNAFLRARSVSGSLVLACSALKESYRVCLVSGLPPERVRWVHLYGDFDLIKARLSQRTGHFMGAGLLASQFADYEAPDSGIKVSVEAPVSEIMEHLMAAFQLGQAEVGLIGLGVMGLNLARNLAGKGVKLSIYNRFIAEKEEGVAVRAVQTFEVLNTALPFEEIAPFVASLTTPRKIILMVAAGPPVDALLDSLLPLLTPGDILIDGGNSHYKDTEGRQERLRARGIHLLGTGISGGADGALHGPAIMAGGNREAFEQVHPLIESLAACNSKGESCGAYMGAGGAGHFVKMTHNGIEYAEMQLIAEVYGHLRYDQGLQVTAIADVFQGWNQGVTGSYLLGISEAILRYTDTTGALLLDQISDQAGNKGTGSWTVMAAAELGVALPSIAAALFARFLAAKKTDRVAHSPLISPDPILFSLDVDALKQTYQFGRLANHIQGLQLIQTASAAHGWKIDLDAVLQAWSGGCILQSELINQLREELGDTSGDIFQLPLVVALLRDHFPVIKRQISGLVQSSLSYPVLNACLDYVKYQTTARSTAYLIQAQRDYFGAHTYQREDDPSGTSYHTDWTLSKSDKV